MALVPPTKNISPVGREADFIRIGEETCFSQKRDFKNIGMGWDILWVLTSVDKLNHVDFLVTTHDICHFVDTAAPFSADTKNTLIPDFLTH